MPAAFANRVISLRVYADRLVLVAESQAIAEHVRVFNRDHSSHGSTLYNWHHYLAVVQRKPGALRNGAPFATLPKPLRTLQSVLLKREGGDRDMADILALVLHHEEALVVQAVTQALDSGVATKTHILNCLSRLLDTPRITLKDLPPTLRMTNEPLANTRRYNDLRENHHVQ